MAFIGTCVTLLGVQVVRLEENTTQAPGGAVAARETIPPGSVMTVVTSVGSERPSTAAVQGPARTVNRPSAPSPLCDGAPQVPQLVRGLPLNPALHAPCVRLARVLQECPRPLANRFPHVLRSVQPGITRVSRNRGILGPTLSPLLSPNRGFCSVPSITPRL